MATSRAARDLDTRARYEWIARAFGVLAAHAKLPPVWGSWDPMPFYVRVDPSDWLDPIVPPGVRVVTLVVPPGNFLDMTAFRAHWNHVMGYGQGGPPWRFTWEGYNGYGITLVGYPFELPTRLPLPDLDYRNPAVWDRPLLGHAEDDTAITHDLNDGPHGLIGGKTLRGKSTLLLNYAIHLVRVGRLQALVMLDPKGGEYPELIVPSDHPAAWDPATCTGICVATPQFSDDGEILSYAPLEQATRAVVREAGRRRVLDRQHHPDRAIWRTARVVWFVDEAADLLTRDPTPNPKDDSADAVRARELNRQREVIDRSMRQGAMLWAKFAMSVIPAAQSPRREFVPGAVHANLAFKTYLGRGDSTEMAIIFGRGMGLPDVPLDIAGRGVWQNQRHDATPADAYLMYQAFQPPNHAIRPMLDHWTPRILEAA